VRDVSVEALGIGVAANIVAAVVTLAVAVFVGAIVAIAASGTTPAPVSDNSAIWIFGIVLVVPGAVSGYVAASFAPSRPLLHGALSALLLPLLVLYTHLGGPMPELSGRDIGLPWYMDDYVIAAVPPLLGVGGAYLRSLAAPRAIGRWTGAVLAVAAVYMIVRALCLTVSNGTFSFSLAAMAGVMAGHYAAPPEHRRVALFVLSGLLAAIFVLGYVGAAISGSPHASGHLVIAANVALGCAIAVMTMRRHYKAMPPRGPDGTD